MFRMKISISRRGPLSPRAIRRYVYRQLRKLFKDCVEEFVLTVHNHVHVDTGMSMASLGPLAKIVGVKGIIMAAALGNGPRKGAYVPVTNTHWEYDPKAIKGPSLGYAQGEEGFVLEFGSEQTPKFRFRFDIKVFQWFLHDESQWGGLEAGKEAFLRKWDAESPTIIDGTVLSRFWATGRLI